MADLLRLQFGSRLITFTLHFILVKAQNILSLTHEEPDASVCVCSRNFKIHARC